MAHIPLGPYCLQPQLGHSAACLMDSKRGAEHHMLALFLSMTVHMIGINEPEPSTPWRVLARQTVMRVARLL